MTIFQDSKEFKTLLDKNAKLETENLHLQDRVERAENLLADIARAYDDFVEAIQKVRR